MQKPIVITRPCPISLDALGVDRSGRSVHCSHCDAEVHALYKLTRAEAEAFVAARRGEKLCVSLRVDARGEPRFADSPEPPHVPVARLRAPGRAAAGLSLALAACTPHGPTRADDDPIDDDLAHVEARPVVPERVVPTEPPAPVESPVREHVTPVPEAPPTQAAPKQPTKSRPKPPPYNFKDDIVDGGL